MNFEINKAIQFAARAHNGQFRKGTDIPYISHPYAVAFLLQEAGVSTEQIIAGILHDVLEDTDCTFEEIENLFGKKVADLVQACSEYDPKAPWENRKKHTCEFLKTASAEVHLIVCADKLHNLRSMAEDYKIVGERIWKRFGRGKEAQAWYYRELAEILCKNTNRQSNSIFEQFDKEVKDFFNY